MTKKNEMQVRRIKQNVGARIAHLVVVGGRERWTAPVTLLGWTLVREREPRKLGPLTEPALKHCKSQPVQAKKDAFRWLLHRHRY